MAALSLVAAAIVETIRIMTIGLKKQAIIVYKLTRIARTSTGMPTPPRKEVVRSIETRKHQTTSIAAFSATLAGDLLLFAHAHKRRLNLYTRRIMDKDRAGPDRREDNITPSYQGW
jgi:hypothetical protein